MKSYFENREWINYLIKIPQKKKEKRKLSTVFFDLRLFCLQNSFTAISYIQIYTVRSSKF